MLEIVLFLNCYLDIFIEEECTTTTTTAATNNNNNNNNNNNDVSAIFDSK